jgi:hypothetical protein
LHNIDFEPGVAKLTKFNASASGLAAKPADGLAVSVEHVKAYSNLCG